MIRRPPRSTQSRSSAASDVYKRQVATVVPGTFATVTSVFSTIRTASAPAGNTPPVEIRSVCPRPDLHGARRPHRHLSDKLQVRGLALSGAERIGGADREAVHARALEPG